MLDLEKGLEEGIYEAVGRDHAMNVVEQGRLVSLAFVVWKGDDREKKGWFFVYLAKQSKHWNKGSIKMETLPSFALESEPGDYLLSFDIKSGYQHFYLHPDMRDFFLFH